MKRNNSEKKPNVGLIPKMARKIGERSANQTCAWWSHQPSVPQSMKNSK
ncbi:MAG TPA: cyclic lactone autoinducer peptide [Candidatus Pelethenecus sp.]|nr:cyclic lactone autoinducer peptide [Candidatus Pelethenecus sp.]